MSGTRPESSSTRSYLAAIVPPGVTVGRLVGRVEDVGLARVELSGHATDDPVAHVAAVLAFERWDGDGAVRVVPHRGPVSGVVPGTEAQVDQPLFDGLPVAVVL